jgi:hypothetical protein
MRVRDTRLGAKEALWTAVPEQRIADHTDSGQWQ